MDDAKGLAIAFEEAKISYDEGGIPVRSPRSSYRQSSTGKSCFGNNTRANIVLDWCGSDCC